MQFRVSGLVFFLLGIGMSEAIADEHRVILDAMTAEMERNSDNLKAEQYDKPYFIGYRVVDAKSTSVVSSFGAVIDDDKVHERRAAVDVRVGDYAFDSHPTGDAFDYEPGFNPSRQVPLDSNPEALRATLWLLTDAGYKKALSTYFKKKAKRVNEVKPKQVNSFSKAPAITPAFTPTKLVVDRKSWRQRSMALSQKFRSMPGLLTGVVEFEVEHVTTYITNTEGTRAIKDYVIYSVGLRASTRADDGMLLRQGRTLYARTPSGLPTQDELVALVDQVIAELKALKNAPVLEPYTGPAILEPEAAGVFFHETIGHRLEGERQNDDQEGQTFKGRVGALILPDFITLRDDPTTDTLHGVQLNGYYPFDDQGVVSEDVTLVKRGVLKTFLTSRTPLEEVSASNGHGRARGTRTPIARMGNLIVESSKVVSRGKLKEMLLAEAKRQGKPFGLIIADITGGSTNTSNYGYQAFKGTPRMVYKVDAATGEETLVRGVEMVGTPLTAINKLVAAGDSHGVFNGYCGAESGYVPVSAVAPSLLFREIELQRTQRTKRRGPLLRAPWHPRER